MTLSKRDLDLVADELEAFYLTEVAGLYRPRWNVAPTDPHLVLRRSDAHRRQLEVARWGFLGTGKKGPPLLINARAESAASRPAFRAAFAGDRCVVPADGFYEWSGTGSARRPYWLHRADGRLLLFAGLHERSAAAPGEVPLGRFTVLTTAANAMVARLHDRMPVILAPGDVDAWLAEGSPALLRPAPEATLVATAVSRRANSVKNDDPACLDPASADGGQDGDSDTGEEKPGKRPQLSLF
jgi:putative SOS response-associated peptidase YedK